MIIRTSNRGVLAFCSLFRYQMAFVTFWDVIIRLVLRPQTITDDIGLELSETQHTESFQLGVFLFFYALWKIGISGIGKGHCFYQMKVKADKSRCQLVPVVKQTKGRFFLYSVLKILLQYRIWLSSICPVKRILQQCLL